MASATGSSNKQQLSYAEIVRMKMKTKDNPTGSPITLRQAQKALGYSYEHLRKIALGDPVVSRSLNDSLSDLLGLDAEEMWTLAQREKIERKLPGAFSVLASPPDDRMRQLWSRLSKQSRERVLQYAQDLARAENHA